MYKIVLFRMYILFSWENICIFHNNSLFKCSLPPWRCYKYFCGRRGVWWMLMCRYLARMCLVGFYFVPRRAVSQSSLSSHTQVLLKVFLIFMLCSRFIYHSLGRGGIIVLNIFTSTSIEICKSFFNKRLCWTNFAMQ